MVNERKTGAASGLDYVVLRDMEIHALPQEVEMKPAVEYTPVQRVQEAWRNRRFMNRPRRDGKR